jgi:hypothetical protein
MWCDALSQVGLLESGPLCEGVTGHTTAKLTSQHGLNYAPLMKKARSGGAGLNDVLRALRFC